MAFFRAHPIPRDGAPWDDISGETFLRTLLIMPIQEAKYSVVRPLSVWLYGTPHAHRSRMKSPGSSLWYAHPLRMQAAALSQASLSCRALGRALKMPNLL